MRCAVIGSRGQLGQELCRRLAGGVVELNRPDFDLARLPDTANLFGADVVINCAAYNHVDRAEQEPDAAFAVNALGVHRLAGLCRAAGAVLVHFSTDHVFGNDPARRHPYTEDDLPGPVSAYGISKLAGEYAARQTPRHFVIRTCGLYGRHGRGGKGNFVDAMLRLADRAQPVRVVSDQVCTPTSTADLAEAVCRLLATEHYGLYHLTNRGACSWHEFATAIFAAAGKRVEALPIGSAEYGAAAARPKYSVLANRAWQALGYPPLRSWQDALAEYLRSLQS